MRWLCLITFFTLALTACVSSNQKEEVTKEKEAESHLLLGVSHLRENNPSKALQELLISERLNPKDPMVHAALAETYVQKQAYDLAEQHFLKAYEYSDQSPQFQSNLGALYLSMERFDDAIAAFQIAADDLTFGRSELAWTGIGYAYFQKKDYAAAERSYKKAEGFNSRYAQAPYRLGELYYAQDRPVEAVVAFKKAVKIAPRFVDAHYWLGLSYMKTRKNDKARSSFEKVVKLAPDSNQAELARKYLDILE
jgi:Tfp pilus assembly protein PilF